MMDYQEPPTDLQQADAQTRTALVSQFEGLKKPFATTDVFVVKSVTLSGGDIKTRHHQSQTVLFNQKHHIDTISIETQNHGDWAMYRLSPNSEGRLSYAFMNVQTFAEQRIGPLNLSLRGVFGAVSGYSEAAILPMAGINLRLSLADLKYDGNKIDIGIEMSAMPYAYRNNKNDRMRDGIVNTTPYLSLSFRPDTVYTRPLRGGIEDSAARKAATRKTQGFGV